MNRKRGRPTIIKDKKQYWKERSRIRYMNHKEVHREYYKMYREKNKTKLDIKRRLKSLEKNLIKCWVKRGLITKPPEKKRKVYYCIKC